MKKAGNKSIDFKLHKKAEELLKGKPTIIGSQHSEAELLRLIHELDVHQIELEMQNEELMAANQLVSKLIRGKAAIEVNELAENLIIKNALQKSIMRSTQILDDMLEGCMIIGFDWTYIYVNDSAARNGQIKRENLVGRSMLEMYPGIENSKVFAHYKCCMDERIPQRFEESYTFNNGMTVWNIFSVEPVKEGIFILATDITDQKRLEKERLELETRYRMLFNEIDEGFCIIEMLFDENEKPIDYRFLEVNPAFAKQTGLLDALGKRIRQLAPKHEEHWFEIYGKIALTGEPARFVNRAEQLHRWYDVYAFRFGQPENRQVAILFKDITKDKQAEEKLQHSEHNLAEAERIGNTGSWDYNVATDTSGWSENMFRIFDIDPVMKKELVFKHFVDNLVHPDDRSHILSVFEDALAGKRPYDLEYRIIKRDGSIRTIHSLAETLFNGNGNAIRMIGKVEDITERKQAEETIKRNLVEITSYYDNAPIGLAVLDINLRFLRINNLLAEINGFPAAEHIGKTVKELLPAFAEQAKEVVSQVIKTDKPVIGIEFKGETSAYPVVKHVWLESWYPIRSDDRNITDFMVIVQDITERKQAEEALFASERQLGFITDNAPVYIAHCDSEKRYKFVNRPYAELFGLQPSDIIGKNAREILNKESYAFASPYMDIVLSGKTTGYDLELPSSPTGPRVISVHAVPEYDTKGKVVGFISVITDITERKQIENKLIEHEHELQQLSAELINAQEKERKILSQELHDEVGQSLTAMKINLASIMKNLPLDHDSKTKNRLQEMNEILDNLISQVHEISLNLRPALLDVLGLLPTIKSYCNQFSKRTGMNVRLANDIIVNLDLEQEIHLFRIVQEALTNVAKHAHAKNLFLNLNLKGNILNLSIQDDGCGFRLNEKGSIPHVGIGLVGMRERVNSLKGIMEIITSPGKGTKIEIQIPINRKHE